MQAETTGSGAAPRADKRRYLALDAFRGLAAVGVAIFHFRWTHPELSTSGPFERLFNLLDFFFVLSGFVLAHVYLSKPQPLGEFVWRRLARLYPLHVFALLMFVLLQVGKLLAAKAGLGTRHEAFEGMNALNFLDTLLLLQSTGLMWHEITWNYPSWTVSTELLSAVIIYALALRYGRRALEPICIAIVAAAVVYMFVFAVEPRDYGPNAFIRTFYGLAMGCLLYRLHARFQFIRGPVWGTLAEVAAIGVVYLALASPATRPVWYLVTFGLAAVIYVFAAEQGLVSQAFRKLQLHRLGTGSYSIYLNHALIGTIFSKLYLTAAAKLGIAGGMSVAVYVPTFILLLIVYSRFTLRYIERPGQTLMMRAWPLVSGLLQPGATPRLTPAFSARKQRVLAQAGVHAFSSRPAASSGVRAPESTASAN
jgi:peptidoglycan/LPS O-acetylase OafA/YrhL